MLQPLSAAAAFWHPPPLPPPRAPPQPPMLPRLERCPGSCLFISEYMEAGPGSVDSFVEFFNGCSSPSTTLSEYTLLICRDGCQAAVGHLHGQKGQMWEGAMQINLPNVAIFSAPPLSFPTA